MELVLKLPANKPPFIGIKFDAEYDASRVNAMWVDNYWTHSYKLILEPSNGNLIVQLREDGVSCNCLYKEVKYNPEALLKFLYATKKSKLFKFGHLVLEGDTYRVVRSQTNRRLFVLNVDDLKILIEH